MINGQKTDPDKEYVVATDDFLAAGGDGYKVFGEAVRASKDYSVAGGMIEGREARIQQFREMGQGRYY